jgi:hypothetical protein
MLLAPAQFGGRYQLSLGRQGLGENSLYRPANGGQMPVFGEIPMRSYPKNLQFYPRFSVSGDQRRCRGMGPERFVPI